MVIVHSFYIRLWFACYVSNILNHFYCAHCHPGSNECWQGCLFTRSSSSSVKHATVYRTRIPKQPVELHALNHFMILPISCRHCRHCGCYYCSLFDFQMLDNFVDKFYRRVIRCHCPLRTCCKFIQVNGEKCKREIELQAHWSLQLIVLCKTIKRSRHSGVKNIL